MCNLAFFIINLEQQDADYCSSSSLKSRLLKYCTSTAANVTGVVCTDLVNTQMDVIVKLTPCTYQYHTVSFTACCVSNLFSARQASYVCLQWNGQNINKPTESSNLQLRCIVNVIVGNNTHYQQWWKRSHSTYCKIVCYTHLIWFQSTSLRTSQNSRSKAQSFLRGGKRLLCFLHF